MQVCQTLMYDICIFLMTLVFFLFFSIEKKKKTNNGHAYTIKKFVAQQCSCVYGRTQGEATVQIQILAISPPNFRYLRKEVENC